MPCSMWPTCGADRCAASPSRWDPGDIVGIAGITGSGRETVLGAIFGASPRAAGDVRIAGSHARPGRPDLAMARGWPTSLPTGNYFAGIMDLPARENISLANLSPFWRGLRLRK